MKSGTEYDHFRFPPYSQVGVISRGERGILRGHLARGVFVRGGTRQEISERTRHLYEIHYARRQGSWLG
jgi:hypothetical protein